MGTEQLGALVANTTFESLSPEAVTAAKSGILDTLGVAMAGAAEPACQLVTAQVAELGGKPQSSVIGHALRTNAPFAALANGMLAHVLDYDDGASSWFGHASAVLLPAVLAMAESRHASGKQTIAAYVVGLEVGGRIGRATGERAYLMGWHNTSTIGSVAAAAAASKILDLDARATATAMGIGASFASGLLKAQTGTMTKPFHAGHGAQNGVMAALLAERGFTASTTALEGDFGFCSIFNAGVDYDVEKLTLDFGAPWDVVDPGLRKKAWPSCRSTHAGIDAALYLRERFHPDPREITKITLRTGRVIPQILRHHHPTIGSEGKFSLEYCVALALLEGEVAVGHFRGAGRFSDPRVLELMSKASYFHPAEWSAGMDAPQELVLHMADGSELSRMVAVGDMKGGPNNRLTEAEGIAKYRQCAAEILQSAEIERSLQLVAELDSVPDVGALMALVTSESGVNA